MMVLRRLTVSASGGEPAASRLPRKIGADGAWRQAGFAWLQALGRSGLWLPALLAAGMGLYFGLASEPAPAFTAAAAMLATAALFLLRARRAARLAPGAALIIIAGFAAAQIATETASPWPVLPRGAATLSGRITAVENLPAGRRILLAGASFDGGPALPRLIRLRLRATDTTPLAAGDQVTLRALLAPPAPPLWPGGPDGRFTAWFSGMGAYGFAIGPVQHTEPGKAPLLSRLRDTATARITAALPGPNGAIAAALLTGEGGAIPAGERAAYAAAGLAHILAVAGLHIGIVMGIAWALPRYGLAAFPYTATRWPVRLIAALAALAAGGAYLLLTGGHIPILRSFAMACLVTLGTLTGRRAISLRGLAFAAALLLLATPEALYSAGLQMSLAAVMALITGWQILRPRWRNTLLRHTAELVLASTLAGTATLPIAAYHFGVVAPWYVPANLLAVPLTALVIMPCVILALLLMPLGLHGLALAPMGWAIGAMSTLAHIIAAWPYASLPVAQLPSATPFLTLAAIALAAAGERRARLLALAPLALLASVILTAPKPDLLLEAGGRLAAIRAGGTAYLVLHHAGAYERQAPARLWGAVDLAPLPRNGGAAQCTAQICRLALPAGTLTVALTPDAPCPLALSLFRTFCDGPVLDRSLVDRLGSATATLAGGALQIAATPAVARPWLPAMLPMAQAE